MFVFEFDHPASFFLFQESSRVEGVGGDVDEKRTGAYAAPGPLF